MKAHVDQVPAFCEEQRVHIKSRCDQLLARIEAEPTSNDWQEQARRGTSKLWYNTNFSDW